MEKRSPLSLLVLNKSPIQDLRVSLGFSASVPAWFRNIQNTGHLVKEAAGWAANLTLHKNAHVSFSPQEPLKSQFLGAGLAFMFLFPQETGK